MYALKKGYNDGDKDFEDALAKIGVSSSGTTSKRKINSQKELIWYSMKDDYVCPNCQGECKVQHKKRHYNVLPLLKVFFSNVPYTLSNGSTL